MKTPARGNASSHRPALSRRAVLGGAAAGLVAGPRAFAQAAPVTIRVGTPFGAVQGIKAAIEEGHFRAENIDIKFVVLGGGPNILAATQGGSIDVGYADLFAWVGSIANGFDLVLLQPANGRGNADYIIAGPNSGVTKPQDLRGKKIGIAAHAQSKLRVVLYLKRFGLSPGDVSFVTVNNRDTVGAALASGQIDAAIAPDPEVAVWEHEYRVRPLEGRPWQQIPEKTATAGFFVTRKWLDANNGVAERFVRAARKGAASYNAYNAAQKAGIALKYDKVDLFKLEKEAPGVIERINDVNAVQDGPLDLDVTASWLQIAKENGTIKDVIDLRAHIYTTALAPRV